MKTIIALLLVAVAGSASAVSLRVGTVRGFPGQTVEVPVSLRYGSNEVRDVVALQADVVFDAGGLGDASPGDGPALTSHVLASSAPVTGTRRLLVYSLENAALTNGVVATIPFTVAPGQYRNFPLTLTNVVLVRADASQVFSTNVSGFIAVSPVYVYPDGHADGFLNVPTNALAEACWVVQATPDFTSWVNIQTNSASGNLLEFSDAHSAGQPQRFYRAVLCTSVGGVAIALIQQMPDGRVHFEYTGAAGTRYIIQASTNLAQWENMSTNVTGGVTGFMDASSTNLHHRFYRVQTAP